MGDPTTPQRRSGDAAVRRFALLTDDELEALVTLLEPIRGLGEGPEYETDYDVMRRQIRAELARRSAPDRHRFTYGVCLDSVMPDPDSDEFIEPAGAVARAEQLRAENAGLTVAIHLWPVP